MRRIKRRVIAFGMLLLMLLSVIPVRQVQAAENDNDTQITFAVVEKPYMELGDTQTIVIGLSATDISEAKLFYQNTTTGEKGAVFAAAFGEQGIQFDIPCTGSNAAGCYVLESISYTVAGDARKIFFSDLGMNISYGVDIVVETEADAVIEEPSDSENAEEEDSCRDELFFEEEDGGLLQEKPKQQEGSYIEKSIKKFANGNYVIVLDPGHDDTHKGAYGNGCHEELLNFKIALYCKEELEKYAGVTVYLTRNSTACPYPGASSGQCLLSRVNFASSVGADAYVSIHLNSGASGDRGAEVYYPNRHYRGDIGSKGENLARNVLKELVALGLHDRGIKIRDSDDDHYADGSVADYYSVIRNGKKAGIPAIIIEHAFVSNGSDVSEFLSSEDGLRRLGMADAHGVANAFGLAYSRQMLLDAYGVWHAVSNGVVDDSYTGIAHNEFGGWYFNNGELRFDYTGFCAEGNKEWYIVNGHVQEGFTGMVENEYGWWYVENGRLLRNYTGYAQNQYGWWWFENGRIAWDYTGMVCGWDIWRYVRNGQVDFGYTGMACNEYGWWYFTNGDLNWNYTGMACNEYGWWYYNNGRLDWSYTGYACNEYGWWWFENGRIAWDYTGMVCGWDIWRYVRNGQVDFGYTGMACNEYGWWYFTNGDLNWNYTGMAENEYGWWYYNSGRLDWGYTGYAQNEYGWWWYQNGQIAWNYTGMVCSGGVWRYVRNGQVDLNYTGMACNEYGWWYFTNGDLNWNYTGMACNEYGWWYYNNGRLDWNYTGYGDNEYGRWWYENGRIVGAA